MISIDSGLLALIIGLAFIAFVIFMFARTENAKNEAWLEAMRRMGRRCPDCGGMGFHLMLPAGTPDSAPNCRTCKGTGELPDRGASKEKRRG